MRTSPLMQSFISHLAEIHNFPLPGVSSSIAGQAPLIVEQDGLTPIVVETPRDNQVRVSFYSEDFEDDGGDLENDDPDMILDFYTGGNAWLLIQAQGPTDYLPIVFIKVDTDGVPLPEYLDFDEAEQRLDAEGSDEQATSWQQQGWFERGRRRLPQLESSER